MEQKHTLLEAFTETQKLISMYKEYKQTEREYEDEVNIHRKQTIFEKLQNISDAMKFSNPVVWIMYKHQAYKNTHNPILTVGSFIEHCAGHGDICSKRYNYLDNYIKNKYAVELKTKYTSNTPLEKLYTDTMILNLVTDDTFMEEWSRHEFNTVDGKTAKWKSYDAQNSSVCPCCN